MNTHIHFVTACYCLLISMSCYVFPMSVFLSHCVTHKKGGGEGGRLSVYGLLFSLDKWYDFPSVCQGVNEAVDRPGHWASAG